MKILKNLRRKFERFCYQNRTKGIPNLMLYLMVGSGLVFFYTVFANDTLLMDTLCFDRELILQGQVWRLISYPLTSVTGNLVTALISLICYYSLGRAMENLWGTCRFNLYYFCGVVLMDIYCMLFGGSASAFYLNLSLFLGYATLYPETHFLLFFIIPVRAWIFALFYLGITAYSVIIYSFPYFYAPFNLFPLVALANYFLFFGSDIKNVFPMSWRANFSRLFRKKKNYAPQEAKRRTGTIPFPNAGSFESSTAKVKAPYHHKCTVCGRTDVSDPDLEFRYCSKCNGYHCYCQDHISNHTHIE